MVTGYLVVVNAAAGSADRDRVVQASAVLRADAPTDVVDSRGPEDVAAAVAALDDRALVVAGGDGSLHLTLRTLWQQEVPDPLVGLLPLGTGNDFARGLGLPLDAVAAAEAIVGGHPRRVDLLVSDDGDVVVNACHAGLGAAAAERSADLKGALGALAYPLGALIAGVREAGWRLRVTVDGDVVHDGGALMVGVANAPYIGAGTRLVPPALPDDGLLDVIVVAAVGPAARLAFGAALRDEAHLDRDDVVHVRGRRVEISGDAVVHDADGELSAPLTSRTYRVEPGFWRFVVAD